MRVDRQGGRWQCLRTGIVLSLILCFPILVQAQDAYTKLFHIYDRPNIYHEAFALPDAHAAALVIAFRIPNPLLAFVKNRAVTDDQGFTANAEVTVQLLRAGKLLEEKIWRQRQTASTFEETQSNSNDLQGMIHFSVQPGIYGYRITLYDPNADGARRSAERLVKVPDFQELAAGEALVSQSITAVGDSMELKLAGLGGDVPYGKPVRIFVPVGYRAGSSGINFRLRKLTADPESKDDRFRRARPGSTEQATGRNAIDPELPDMERPVAATEGTVIAEGEVPQDSLVPLPEAADILMNQGTLQWSRRAARPAGYLAPVDVGSAALQAGYYVLDVALSAHGQSAAAQVQFQTHWRNMPISLYDLVVAIKNLRFIEDRKLVQEMLKGSREQREAHFQDYWKRRDPTPETMFNELMDEYYRRVDYAATTFRTGKVAAPDGLRTDQARIFIVNGPPSAVERSFPESGGVEERWNYPKGRFYVFRAASSLDPFALTEASSQ